jgi:hypothetical protein
MKIIHLSQTKIKMWLDDERDPTSNVTKSLFQSDGTEIWVKTYEEAIDLLSKGNVEFVSLDHDLGKEKTGYDVAKWIEENAYYGNLKPIQWRIHSQNQVGASSMKKALESADKYWNQKDIH